MTDEIDVLANELERLSTTSLDVASPAKSGVYAYFLSGETKSIGDFSAGRGGLIYVGASSNLSIRELDAHFKSKNTGFSTLRRSLGAILRDELALTAIPRGSGKSKSDVTNYRFRSDGEARLTAWMTAKLTRSARELENEERIEGELIRRLEPLLNLKGWPNPHRNAIKRLRKQCADEARANR